MPKPIVYLAGPINGQSDAAAKDWRSYVVANYDGSLLDPMVRDCRGLEDERVSDIVEMDKRDILVSDAVLAYCPQPSYGTAMEIMFAWLAGKKVVVVIPDGPVSPWVRYHASLVVDSLDEALGAVTVGGPLFCESEWAEGT